MKLSLFIQANMEQITAEWERYAATLLPEEEFSKSILRDGIVDMLNEIVQDINAAQTDEQQQDKSEGAPRRMPHIDDAAERHALARVKMGLSSRQLISEFRALRATVIRLWQTETPQFDSSALYDLTRFNEAIDQALSEAAARYSEEIERARELFLGILGHDLRNPLAAISGWAELQVRTKIPENCPEFARHISTSAARMSYMIDDLMELARVRLGTGIIINRTPSDLQQICTNVLREMQAIYADRTFHLICPEPLPGEWDADRMSQVLSNLLGNAIQHGYPASPITLTANHHGNNVELTVHNDGPPIAPDSIPKLFDSLFRGPTNEMAADDQSTSLGLGLYIAREIVTSHGGTISAASAEGQGTIFTIHLPNQTTP